MSYELLDEDEKSYKLKHPKHGEVVIAKQAISDVLHEKIRSMRKQPLKMADGGEVPDDMENLGSDITQSVLNTPAALQDFSQPAPAPEPPPDKIQDRTSLLPGQRTADIIQADRVSTPSNLIASNDSIPADAIPIGGEMVPGRAPSQEAPPGSKASMTPDIMGIENKMLAAQQQKTKAEQDLAKGQEQMYADYNKQLQDHMKLAQANYAKVDSEINKYSQEVANGRINPNRLWDDATTGGKISAAIGLILGGIGAGLAGGPNQALQVMQKSIDRDIDAQKANLGKSQNLLSMNMQRYNNLHVAEAATRAQMGAAIQGQLAQMQARAANPIAAANGQMAQAQIQQAMLPTKMMMARWNAAVQTKNPGMMVSVVVPEHQQPEAYKELTAMQNLGAGMSNALEAFDKINKLNTVVGRATRLGMERADVKALREPITAQLSKDTAGRFTEQDAHMLDTLWPAPGDLPKTVATKRAALQKLISQKMHSPLLDSWGVPYKTQSIQTFRPEDFKR